MVLYARNSSAKVRMQCKESVIILSFLWVMGLICGLYLVASSDSMLLEYFYAASGTRPSIAGILVVIFLPIAVSAIAAYFSAPVLIYGICFFKAFCFSFALCGVVSVFGYSGWLVRLLLLFSDSCMAVLLFWLWCKFLSLKRNTVHRDLLICVAIAAIVGTVDYFLVSPYLVILMHYS